MRRPGGAQSGSGVDRIGGKVIQFHNVGGWIVWNEEWGLMPSVGVIGSQAINKCVVCLSCHCYAIFDFKLGPDGFGGPPCKRRLASCVPISHYVVNKLVRPERP